jgi:serine/threonine protein kinase
MTLDRISHYRILDRIGVGGMGTVYRAQDERSGRIVAVKVLHPHLASDPQYIRRFRREARIARSLDSPHVVQVLDYGQEGPNNYLVMEYVSGGDLAALIKRTGPLPIASVVSIARQVTLALAEGHRKGIVHRDVTPQNILFAEDGTAKLADFGIARDVTDLATMATTFMGKPHYASPDQWSGTVDIRSDIYSLGTVLYEMLAGVPPFSGPTPMAVMRQHDQADAPPLAKARPDAPPELVQVVQRCLAKRPDQRYQTPSELLYALLPFEALSTEGRQISPTRVAPGSRKTGGTRPALIVGAVMAMGGVMTAFVVAVSGGGNDDSAEGSVRLPDAIPETTLTETAPTTEPDLAPEATTVPPDSIEEPQIGPPIRANCDEIRADPTYRSDEERHFFLDSCSPTPVPPSSGASDPQAEPSGLTQRPAPTATPTIQIRTLDMRCTNGQTGCRIELLVARVTRSGNNIRIWLSLRVSGPGGAVDWDPGPGGLISVTSRGGRYSLLRAEGVAGLAQRLAVGTTHSGAWIFEIPEPSGTQMRFNHRYLSFSFALP